MCSSSFFYNFSPATKGKKMLFLDSVIHRKLSDCFSTFSYNYLHKCFFTLQLGKIFSLFLIVVRTGAINLFWALLGKELSQITLNLCIIFSISLFDVKNTFYYTTQNIYKYQRHKYTLLTCLLLHNSQLQCICSLPTKITNSWTCTDRVKNNHNSYRFLQHYMSF
jgi:hypothetical protein